jgi:hypothetical protein
MGDWSRCLVISPPFYSYVLMVDCDKILKIRSKTPVNPVRQQRLSRAEARSLIVFFKTGWVGVALLAGDQMEGLIQMFCRGRFDSRWMMLPHKILAKPARTQY